MIPTDAAAGACQIGGATVADSAPAGTTSEAAGRYRYASAPAAAQSARSRSSSAAGAGDGDAGVFKRSAGIRRHATGRGKGRKAAAESGNDILEVPHRRSQLPEFCSSSGTTTNVRCDLIWSFWARSTSGKHRKLFRRPATDSRHQRQSSLPSWPWPWWSWWTGVQWRAWRRPPLLRLLPRRHRATSIEILARSNFRVWCSPPRQVTYIFIFNHHVVDTYNIIQRKHNNLKKNDKS